MANLLVCVCTPNQILNYVVFSREKAKIKFDGAGIGIALRHDPCTNAGQYFLMRLVPLIHEGDHTSQYDDQDSRCTHSSNTNSQVQTSNCKVCGDLTDNKQNKIQHRISFVQLVIRRKLSLLFPSDLACCCFQEILKSELFRHRFLRYIGRKGRGRWRDGWFPVCDCIEVETMCECSITVPKLIEIFIQPPQVHVCLAWCYRIEGLAVKRMILEETMAWLSTLGGGYSSLGDYFTQFSERARQISVTQLRIAMEMGDPIMAAKCRLFFALSLMQQRALKQSKLLIRREYHFARHYKHQDQKLVDMCLGMWSKLQYFYSRRRKAKLFTTSQNLSTTSNGKYSSLPAIETVVSKGHGVG